MTVRPHRPRVPAHPPDALPARQPSMQPVISSFTNSLKTWTLLAALGGLLVAVGGLLGGRSGLVFALLFASGGLAVIALSARSSAPTP